MVKYKVLIRFCVTDLMPEEYICNHFGIENCAILRLYIEGNNSTKSMNFPLSNILKYDVELVEE